MSDQEYIDGLIKQDDRILRMIYQQFADRIANFILKNGGSRADAKDVFQDALIIILEKAQTTDFKLSSSFYTYLFGVNKLVWYNKSRKKYRSTVTMPDDNTLRDNYNIEKQLLDRELDTIYRENFKKFDFKN